MLYRCRLHTGRFSDVRMHGHGAFDVTDDAEGHVTDSQPITKSLLQLRPDKIVADRRASRQDVGKTAGSDDSWNLAATRAACQRHPPTASGSCQPASVSKSGGGGGAGSRQPEVECARRRRAVDSSGSLRDRWRLLNDEFKRVYQRRAQSPEATPPQSQATPPQGQAPPTQGQPKVTKVNRFKDIDRRFSNIRRVVGNMSARLQNNSTSGREMTSSKPEVVLWPTTGEDRDGRAPEMEMGEGFVSESARDERDFHVASSLADCLATVTRPSFSERPHSTPTTSPTVAGSESTSWYFDSRADGRASDGRPGSRLRELLPVGGDTPAWRGETRAPVQPPGECCGDNSCSDAGSVTSSSDNVSDDVSSCMTSRDSFCREDDRHPRMVRYTTQNTSVSSQTQCAHRKPALNNTQAFCLRCVRCVWP